jgi:hypothetical protein
MGETIVIGGKPYEIKPTELKTCGSQGSPEYAATTFLIEFAQSNGEKIYETACKAGIQEKCTKFDVKKFGIEQVFQFIRQYPSGTSNAGCKALRSECEDRCSKTALFDEKTCLIECNQYETWNR